MPRTESSRFTIRAEGNATLFEIRPAKPEPGFIAAAVLLGGLFGLPALAVLLNPGRRDPLSLTAAGCALLILALAGGALRRALRGRRAVTLRLDDAGLEVRGERPSWDALAGRRVERPETAPPAGATGIHGLAAAVAARQRAAEARLWQERRDGAPPLLLASGLEAATAERLCAALDAAAARYQ
ncbi:hypothetical protein [Roseomonas marmotae]|uniref:Integral membrane protein n=1 Tax=Roseomonas marmotae TaxID=2768161 RepID=A0ABS3KF26_9PROT|nr:hypothetical protein [Roseomonas marmotae]MBO1076072.1 hypothetical protein [Roseomonas marmotae]QTI81311.1 hypothetical protein IAI58_18310 [Roseomonas marmotae]